MPFSFPTVDRFASTPYEGRNVPFFEWGAHRFEQATTQTAGRRLWGFGFETLFDNSRILLPNEATRLYGIPEAGLTYDYPVREETAKGRKERKERELLFQSNAASATHSGWSPKAFATFPFAVAGQLTDPLELAINAIPFVGIGSKAAGMARLGGATVTPLAERGVLVSMEQIAKHVRYPVLAGRVLEATAGNVIAEIPVAIQNIRDQADYELSDSLMNIALGGVFSASIHAVTRGLRGTSALISKASDETRTKAVNTGIGQVMRGEGIDVGREFAIDKNVHLEQLRFDETAAMREALQTPEVREAIKFEAMAAASDVVSKLKAADVAGAIDAVRALPITRDIIDSKIDISNTITALKEAISILPDIGRVEVDGRPLNQWIESIETGRSIEPTQFQKRSAEQLRQIAEMKRVPERLRQMAREAAETRRLNEEFAPGSIADHSYREKVGSYVEAKRQEFDTEARKAKQKKDAEQELSERARNVSQEDLRRMEDLRRAPNDPDNIASRKPAEAGEQVDSVSVTVRQMKNGKPVTGTVEMPADVALRGLEDRMKILTSLMECLGK